MLTIIGKQDIPEIKMIVMLGELGGDNEYGIVKALKEKKVQFR